MKERIADLIARIDDTIREDESVLKTLKDHDQILVFETHRNALGGCRNELSKILKESE